MKEEIIIHRQIKGFVEDTYIIDIPNNMTLEQKKDFILKNQKDLEFIKRDKLKFLDSFEELPKYYIWYNGENLK